MKLDYAPRALAALESASERIRRAFYKQVRLLAANPRHPSLRTKKYNDGKGWWQARVNDEWRFYFTIVDETYVIQDVIKHPK
jgi:mRNA-degrading endonuclease RelE of RelBE toxin-antitoxin system